MYLGHTSLDSRANEERDYSAETNSRYPKSLHDKDRQQTSSLVTCSCVARADDCINRIPRVQERRLKKSPVNKLDTVFSSFALQIRSHHDGSHAWVAGGALGPDQPADEPSFYEEASDYVLPRGKICEGWRVLLRVATFTFIVAIGSG